MARNRLVIEAVLVLVLVVGIVGGNFMLNRRVIGDAASRAASADTVTSVVDEDLEQYAPQRFRSATAPAARDSVSRRDNLRKLVLAKLPQATPEEIDAWCDELGDLSLSVAEGILDLKAQVGKVQPEAAQTPAESNSGSASGVVSGIRIRP